MAWRPTSYLREGELDNSTLGRVTGWMRFAGLETPVQFDLRGDFHRDIRGARIRLRAEDPSEAEDPIFFQQAREYMEGFALLQTGEAGDITAGLPPQDYTSYPYIEWYSEQNGRVVLELAPEAVDVLSPPVPVGESDPVDRNHQARLMMGFLGDMARALQENHPQESDTQDRP